VFLNDTLITDRVALSDPVTDADTVAVFQALSGGAT
jgi:molybdopterin converting factor small subunit